MNSTAPIQVSLAHAEQEKKEQRTRRELFFENMEHVISWCRRLEVIGLFYPKSGKRGRPPLGLERMLRMCFLQQRYALADEAVVDTVYDS